MGNWKLDTESVPAVVWDEDAPDPVDEEEAGVEGINLGREFFGTDGTDEGDEFDPSGHTIDDVKSYIDSHPDEVQRVYDAEVEGKGRQTLLDWLTAS